jgi:hypothetical protein
MDYDRNQFLTDVFEKLVSLPGDPVAQIDVAISRIIDGHVKALRRLVQQHREEIIDMAEERRRTGKPVPTRWKV